MDVPFPVGLEEIAECRTSRAGYKSWAKHMGADPKCRQPMAGQCFKHAICLKEVIINEPSDAVPVLRIQENISAQIDEQFVDVPAAPSQEDIANSAQPAGPYLRLHR